MTKVLVIDDEEAIRFVFHRFLTDAGYEVSLAEHEKDAREILSNVEFDVAVVDRILPGGMNGLQLFKEITELQPSCKVIMISGFTVYQDASQASEKKPFKYLTKPIKKDEIIHTVKAAAEESMTHKAKISAASD